MLGVSVPFVMAQVLFYSLLCQRHAVPYAKQAIFRAQTFLGSAHIRYLAMEVSSFNWGNFCPPLKLVPLKFHAISPSSGGVNCAKIGHNVLGNGTLSPQRSSDIHCTTELMAPYYANDIVGIALKTSANFVGYSVPPPEKVLTRSKTRITRLTTF